MKAFKIMEKLGKYHRFFVEKSPSFMEGTPRLKYYATYPIAYLKFMYYSL